MMMVEEVDSDVTPDIQAAKLPRVNVWPVHNLCVNGGRTENFCV